MRTAWHAREPKVTKMSVHIGKTKSSVTDLSSYTESVHFRVKVAAMWTRDVHYHTFGLVRALDRDAVDALERLLHLGNALEKQRLAIVK